MKNYAHFPSSLKYKKETFAKMYTPFLIGFDYSIAYFSFFGIKISKQLKVCSCFSLPKFYLLLFYLMERVSATYYILQANSCFFCWFFEKCQKKLPLLKLLYFPFFRWNMWHLSRKQLIKFLFWFWHRKNNTRLYSSISSYLFHIKSHIIYYMLSS